MNGLLSRSFEESTGVKQGNSKCSDHYNIYVNVAQSVCAKTKITVVGSTIDQNYFKELSPWQLGGQ